MPCLTCDEMHATAYAKMIKSKLAEYFTNHPCVDCGETDIDLLDTADQRVWEVIADHQPWRHISMALQSSEVLCVSCIRRRAVAAGNHWGL